MTCGEGADRAQPMGIAELFGFRPQRETSTAAAVYAAIVAQAREPGFFLSLGVPDTVDGRFETVALHVFLALRRLKLESSEAAAGLSRALVEEFVSDMDRSLREMGAADLGVGRRVRTMAEGLYGRIRAYEAALAKSGNAALAAALRRNVYGTVDSPDDVHLLALARYVRRQHANLAAQNFAALRVGRIQFLALSIAIGSVAQP
jgi:cytochrome b pre-mRNA-processing protein 3